MQLIFLIFCLLANPLLSVTEARPDSEPRLQKPAANQKKPVKNLNSKNDVSGTQDHTKTKPTHNLSGQEKKETTLASSIPAKAPHIKLKVVTTLPVLAALAREIGGEKVTVNTLTKATEDPHSVRAKPTFKRLLSEADLFIQMGRSLEPWATLVLNSVGNAKISGNGLVTASTGIKMLEVVPNLSRSHGDVHPQGNPHGWLSPTAAVQMALNIKNSLIAKDAQDKDYYERNFLRFKQKISAHMPDWQSLAKQIDYTFITYHSVWTYLADEFGLKVFPKHIEEKSGLPPTLRYQNELVKDAKAKGVKHIVAASYYVGSTKLISFIAEQIGGRYIFIDADCREGETYFDMMNRIFRELVSFKSIIKS